MKKVYFGVAVAIVYAAIFGFLAPMLMSTKNDIAVLIGLAVLLIAAIIPVHVGYNKFIKPSTKDPE